MRWSFTSLPTQNLLGFYDNLHGPLPIPKHVFAAAEHKSSRGQGWVLCIPSVP